MLIKKGMKNKQAGVGLIEVMIGLFVLAIGLLGFVGLLTSSMTMGQRSYTLTQAVFLAENYADRVRANRDVANLYAILPGTTPAFTSTLAAQCDTNACNENEMVNWDKGQWYEQMQNILPGASADVTVNVDNVNNRTTLVINLNYAIKLGKAGTGDAAGTAQLQNTRLTTEI